MKTIFDYNVTDQEIKQLGFLDDFQRVLHNTPYALPITQDSYKANVPEEFANFDIAKLLEHRGEDATAFWEKIPQLAQEYKLGNDYVIVPTE